MKKIPSFIIAMCGQAGVWCREVVGRCLRFPFWLTFFKMICCLYSSVEKPIRSAVRHFSCIEYTSKKIRLDMSCELTARQTIHFKYKALVSPKITKYFKMLSAAVVICSNGVKQGCVLAPTLFIMMLSAMLTAAFQDGNSGIPIRYRFDGKLFKLRRLQAKSKVQTVLDEFFLLMI